MSSEYVGEVIAEVQGLYGPVTIAEILVQKLWYRQEFSRRDLRTRAGKSLIIHHPGRWNRLGGPDFKGAEWEIDGQRRIGDVEIHFYQRDWFAHGHETNPAFNDVGLHVVVFDPDPDERPAFTQNASSPALLVLAPQLDASLEEVAWREAMRLLDGGDPLDLAAPLLALPVNERRAHLIAGAHRRWNHKLHFARRRLETEGWRATCHQVALEILGYRANRQAMADLAVRHPLEDWRGVDLDWIEQRLEEGAWSYQGIRPANHPRRRLEQYRLLVCHNPRWPERLAEFLISWSTPGRWEEGSRPFRQQAQLGNWRRKLQNEVFGGQLGSPRLDTLVIDGILPLAAARWGSQHYSAAWFHWFPGDLPDKLRVFLRVAGLSDAVFPVCNGMQQGALDCLYTRDAAQILPAG